eukprot:TRINITY_DN11742_c1_g1_i1.p5 TRINITY_DN11742_c1_g1~~TRINITY_DN11742_c1_g1_i1.p5  ORF type:complete len:164 (-),score=5.12 TRINITY_DN11742_c1_g1_i1:247-738(-)
MHAYTNTNTIFPSSYLFTENLPLPPPNDLEKHIIAKGQEQELQLVSPDLRQERLNFFHISQCEKIQSLLPTKRYKNLAFVKQDGQKILSFVKIFLKKIQQTFVIFWDSKVHIQRQKTVKFPQNYRLLVVPQKFTVKLSCIKIISFPYLPVPPPIFEKYIILKI